MSAWDSSGVVGPTGPQGPQGPIGPQGIAGLSAQMIIHSETTVQVVNVSTEQLLFLATIPAGAVKVGDTVRLVAYGDFLSNTGGTLSIIPRLYVAGNLVLDGAGGTTPTMANNTGRGSWRLEWHAQVASMSSQRGNVFGILGLASAPGTSLHLQQSGASGFVFWGGSYDSVLPSINMASAWGMQMNVQLSTANALADIRLHGYTVEKLAA